METTSHDLTPQAPSALLAQSPAGGFNQLLRVALDKGPEFMREMLAARREWMADEARAEFNFAVAEFQRRCPIIEKGDFANKSAYARMDRIWRTIRPISGELGLAITWNVSELREEGHVIHLDGFLRHRAGHSERVAFDIMIPDSPANSQGRDVMNRAQTVGSAQTYAERYATCAALGIVTGEDDDGNGGVVVTLDAAQQKQIKDLVAAWKGIPNWTQEREDVFWRFVDTKDLGKVNTHRYADIVDMLRRSMGKNRQPSS